MLTRTQKKRQDEVIQGWLFDHGIPSLDDFLDSYHLIIMTDRPILDDLYARLEASVGLRQRHDTSDQV